MGCKFRTSLKEADKKSILWLAHWLMIQDGGDGDCTVVCDDYKQWAEDFKTYIKDRGDDKRMEIFEHPDSVCFAWDQECVVFTNYVKDYPDNVWCGYTWMIIVED